MQSVFAEGIAPWSGPYNVAVTNRNPNFALLFVVQIGAGIAILAAIVLLPTPWNWKHWLGLALATPAIVLLFAARYQLGRAFSVTPQARQLVSHGIYSKIRNPIYVFSALLILGFLLALQRPVLFALLAILTPLQILRARQESKVLEEKFGEEYRKYKQNTWF
jgi:protein-S-isoprenylcysteine O-methyltransferase Ste14